MRRASVVESMYADALSQAQLERLHAGLLRLATMDEAALAGLVEHVLAGDDLGPADNGFSREIGPRVWHRPRRAWSHPTTNLNLLQTGPPRPFADTAWSRTKAA